MRHKHREEEEDEERGRARYRERERERKRQIDKERERGNILPLCQYNIYANHAFSICVNFITHKGLMQSPKKNSVEPKNQRLSRSFTAEQENTTGGRNREEHACRERSQPRTTSVQNRKFTFRSQRNNVRYVSSHITFV